MLPCTTKIGINKDKQSRKVSTFLLINRHRGDVIVLSRHRRRYYTYVRGIINVIIEI